MVSLGSFVDLWAFRGISGVLGEGLNSGGEVFGGGVGGGAEVQRWVSIGMSGFVVVCGMLLLG